MEEDQDGDGWQTQDKAPFLGFIEVGEEVLEFFELNGLAWSLGGRHE